VKQNEEVFMGRINWGRVVLGGIVAGVIANVLEGAFGFLMHSEFEAAMKNLKPPGGAVMAAHLLWSFVIGIAAIWLYAAIRPRYGPGAATALRAGFAVWLFVHATFSLATGTMDLLPQKIMLISAAWSLPETLAATLAGAWVYREGPGP
jgi:hypothetical protein